MLDDAKAKRIDVGDDQFYECGTDAGINRVRPMNTGNLLWNRKTPFYVLQPEKMGFFGKKRNIFRDCLVNFLNSWAVWYIFNSEGLFSSLIFFALLSVNWGVVLREIIWYLLNFCFNPLHDRSKFRSLFYIYDKSKLCEEHNETSSCFVGFENS